MHVGVNKMKVHGLVQGPFARIADLQPFHTQEAEHVGDMSQVVVLQWVCIQVLTEWKKQEGGMKARHKNTAHISQMFEVQKILVTCCPIGHI